MSEEVGGYTSYQSYNTHVTNFKFLRFLSVLRREADVSWLQEAVMSRLSRR